MQPQRLYPKRRCRVGGLFLIPILLLIPSADALSVCLPPIVHAPAVQPDGTVLVKWVHPDVAADTIRTFSLGFQRRFFVSPSGSGHRIAFRLPATPPTSLLYALRAFFSSQDGVGSAAWSGRARFSWSLQADSSGRPGPAVSDSIHWPLGDYAILRGGGWFEGGGGWWLPDSLATGSWLVGSWPDVAIGVVALGAENAAPPLQTLAGMDQSTGPVWVELPNQALLAEIVVLTSVMPQTGVNAASSNGLPDYLVLRELIDGPFSPSTDTLALSTGSGQSWEDTTAVAGQALRYGVVSVCGTDTSSPAWTEPLRLPTGALRIEPELFDLVMTAETDTVLFVDLCNTAPTDAIVSVETPRICAAAPVPPQPMPPCIASGVFPNLVTLPPQEVQRIELQLNTSGSPSGIFAGDLTIVVMNPNRRALQQLALPVKVTVDVETDVQPNAPEEGQYGAGDEWMISPERNPFGDEIAIRINRTGTTFTGDGASSSVSFEPVRLENAVYSVFDIRGRVLREGTADLSALSGGSGTLLRIPGTGDWPSGVYICRITLGERDRAVKMMHVK